MQAPIYGSLAVAHNTGGLHDTVEPLDWNNSTGNGFRFDTYDSGGLMWAMEQAMAFYSQPIEIREREISRIMDESIKRFNHQTCAKEYIKLYETMLSRPLVKHN
jgi:glycogen synthase